MKEIESVASFTTQTYSPVILLPPVKVPVKVEGPRKAWTSDEPFCPVKNWCAQNLG